MFYKLKVKRLETEQDIDGLVRMFKKTKESSTDKSYLALKALERLCNKNLANAKKINKFLNYSPKVVDDFTFRRIMNPLVSLAGVEGNIGAIDPMFRYLDVNYDSDSAYYVTSALGRIGDERVIPRLLSYRYIDGRLRYEVFGAFQYIKATVAIPDCLQALDVMFRREAYTDGNRDHSVNAAIDKSCLWNREHKVIVKALKNANWLPDSSLHGLLYWIVIDPFKVVDYGITGIGLLLDIATNVTQYRSNFSHSLENREKASEIIGKIYRSESKNSKISRYIDENRKQLVDYHARHKEEVVSEYDGIVYSKRSYLVNDIIELGWYLKAPNLRTEPKRICKRV